MQHTDWELSCRRVIVEESMTTFPSGRQPTLSEAVKWTTAQKAVASIELETKGSVNKRTPNRVRVKRKSRPRRSRSRYRVTEAAGASPAIQHKAAGGKRDHVRQLPNESDAPQRAATSCVGRSLCGQLLPERRARRQLRWTSQGTLPRMYQQSILRRRLSNGTPNHWNRDLRDMQDPLTDTDSRIKPEHCVNPY